MLMQQKIDEKCLFIPDNLFFECVNCGICCKNWHLEISADDCRNLTENESYLRLEKLIPNVPPVYCSPENNKVSLHKVDDTCVMFQSNVCLIHRELGYEVKPYVCRKFPFVLSGTPDGVFVGVSFKCESIRKKSGKPLTDYTSSIMRLLQENPPDNIGKETVALTDNFRVSWESYCLLEEFLLKCLEIPDIFSAVWIPLGMTTSLICKYAGKNETAPVLLDMTELSAFDEDMLQGRNEEMFQYQMEFAASIISTIENWENSPNMEDSHIILNGGVIESDTYLKKLAIKGFSEYLEISEDELELSDFRSYLEHIIKWRKQLLRFDNLFVGLIAFSFMPFLFIWYSFTSAISRGKEKPEEEDFKNALGFLDIYFHHWNLSEFFFHEFAKGILKETERYSLS